MAKPNKSSKPRSDQQQTTGKQAKQAADRRSVGSASQKDYHQISVELQQLLLAVFQSTFKTTLSSDNFTQILQEVKGFLYERAFDRAFGTEAYLDAYAARWSPSRALCYASIFAAVSKTIEGLQAFGALSETPKERSEARSIRILSLGGGAAEIVGWGGFMRKCLGKPSLISKDLSVEKSQSQLDGEVSRSQADRKEVGSSQAQDAAASEYALSREPFGINLTLLDTAPWGNVVGRLLKALVSDPPVSKYASAAVKASVVPLVREQDFTADFKQEDIFELDRTSLKSLLGDDPTIVTLLFTLNELYTASIRKTTTFLLDLTAVATPDTVLLVVDSPGSYSETTVGKEQKKYPMQWLLQHTLLEGQEVKWERLIGDDSKWFRLDKSLSYPIPLEDMRYQIHLFRRC